METRSIGICLEQKLTTRIDFDKWRAAKIYAESRQKGKHQTKLKTTSSWRQTAAGNRNQNQLLA